MHFASRHLWLALVSLLNLGARAAETAPERRAFVWQADVPGGNAELVRHLAAVAEEAGFAVEFLESTALTNTARVTAANGELLVLPHARLLPVESLASITRYLSQGGNLLALGLTAWERPTFRLAGRWTSRDEYVAALDRVRPERRLLDLEAEDVSRWIRHSSSPQRMARREKTNDGGAAVRVRIEKLDGWDTLEIPGRTWRFEPGQSLTCFRAKGNAATPQLAVEWIERDGSRWIATVDLSADWRYYALPPEAFRPWQPPSGRGGEGDRLQVQNVVRSTVGLAHTHTGVGTGPLEYAFADLGTAANPFGDETPPAAPAIPRLESLAPGYQIYPISTRCVVRPWAGTSLGNIDVSASTLPSVTGSELRAFHPRPGGAGFNQGRPWRWQPLLTAFDAMTQEHRGAVGVMVAHEKQGTWLLFSPDSPSFYANAVVREALRGSVRRLRQGLCLDEGGAEFFTLFPDQSVRLGARVRNRSARAHNAVEVSIEVRALSTDQALYQHRATRELAPGESHVVETVWNPAAWPVEGCRVTVHLRQGGVGLDELSHELNRWRPPADPAFVEARNGGLWVKGQPWKAHGVNYMPSSGIGVANAYFESWLGRGAYDPEVIERDLRRVQGLGLNAVSAFVYYRDLAAQHLLDFLFRCERLGLKVNLSLRPGTPMDFRWREVKALIEHYRLAQNDTVMAYDLAWEPSHYDHAFQVRNYAALWDAFVRDHHGSVESAARAWELAADEVREGDSPRVAIPQARKLINDGPWRRYVGDYRQFLDELLAARYGEARRLVRTIDPHHPVSFRMQHAGDPTLLAESLFPYDLWGLRDAVDLWEPEAYGRIGDWERVKPGHFTAAFARLCDPTKPVLWSEMGVSVWDPNAMAPGATKLDFAARYYRDFYRMLRESGADGVFFWWYPGGYRLNENSDHGILEPDGTDRTVTRVIREEGARFLAAPKPPAPTLWISVDRDRDARGLPGIYEAVQDEYWRAVEGGRTVGLSWARPPRGVKP